jgi:uncharacterized protein with beta-barrel porin domain
MNRTLRLGLLATGSALAMIVASEGAAFAQCFYNNGTNGNTNPLGTTKNCMSYNNGTANAATLTNDGTLAPTGVYTGGHGTNFPGTASGISVLGPGTKLTGNIINNGTINTTGATASQGGINIGGGEFSKAVQTSGAGAAVIGSITNSGTITGSIGIVVGGGTGSTVTGAIVNNNAINASNVGISIQNNGSVGSITNAGTISSGGAPISISAATIVGNVVNTGTGLLSSTKAFVALSIANGGSIGGSIENFGAISANVVGIEVYPSTTEPQTITGSIINEAGGTITAEYGIALTANSITRPNVVGGSVINNGTLNVSVIGIGVFGATVGGITNGTGGAIKAKSFGIAVSSGFSNIVGSVSGSIVNKGTITVTSGTGILVGGGSVVKGGIVDTGTINASADAINLTGEGAATAITISGGTAAVTGNIVGNGLAAGDTLNFEPGAGNTFTYDSNFSAIQQVNVTSGTVVLNGGANSSSTLTVSGGTLAGTGTIATAMTVQSGGAFAPGTPGTPGTSMTITGSLAFLSGALYVVYLNPSTSSLASVTGTASLNGTVDANFASGSYAQKQYTILTTTGGLAGTKFANLTPVGLPPGFAASLSYNTDDVFLNLTATMGLQQTGLTQNELAVAAAIDKYFNTVGSLPPNFANLFALSGAQLANALQQLDGEDATGAQTGAFTLMTEFLDLLQEQTFGGGSGGSGGGSGGLGFAPDEQAEALPPDLALAYDSILKAPPQQTFGQRWTAWGAGFGGGSFTQGNAVVGSNNVTATTYGTAAGMQYRADPSTILGFALAGSGLNWGLAQGLGSGRSEAFQAGAYGKTYLGAAYLSGELAFGNNWFTTNRNALGDQLTASFTGQSYAARGEAGYRYSVPVTGSVIGITPYGALQSQWFLTPSYSETDLTAGGAFGLAYAANTASDTRSELGARFDDLTTLNNLPLILRARLAWAHDWTNGTGLGAVFESLPGSSFTVNGATIPPNSALTSASAQYFFTPSWSFTAKFDGEFASSAQTYAGSGTLRYQW